MSVLTEKQFLQLLQNKNTIYISVFNTLPFLIKIVEGRSQEKCSLNPKMFQSIETKRDGIKYKSVDYLLHEWESCQLRKRRRWMLSFVRYSPIVEIVSFFFFSVSYKMNVKRTFCLSGKIHISNSFMNTALHLLHIETFYEFFHSFFEIHILRIQ